MNIHPEIARIAVVASWFDWHKYSKVSRQVGALATTLSQTIRMIRNMSAMTKHGVLSVKRSFLLRADKMRLVRLPANKDETVTLAPLFDFRGVSRMSEEEFMEFDRAIPGSEQIILSDPEAGTLFNEDRAAMIAHLFKPRD